MKSSDRPVWTKISEHEYTTVWWNMSASIEKIHKIWIWKVSTKTGESENFKSVFLDAYKNLCEEIF